VRPSWSLLASEVHLPPGSELQLPPGSELQLPPGSELQLPPGSELQLPPGSELQLPPGSETLPLLVFHHINYEGFVRLPTCCRDVIHKVSRQFGEKLTIYN